MFKIIDRTSRIIDQGNELIGIFGISITADINNFHEIVLFHFGLLFQDFEPVWKLKWQGFVRR